MGRDPSRGGARLPRAQHATLSNRVPRPDGRARVRRGGRVGRGARPVLHARALAGTARGIAGADGRGGGGGGRADRGAGDRDGEEVSGEQKRPSLPGQAPIRVLLHAKRRVPALHARHPRDLREHPGRIDVRRAAVHLRADDGMQPPLHLVRHAAGVLRRHAHGAARRAGAALVVRDAARRAHGRRAAPAAGASSR